MLPHSEPAYSFSVGEEGRPQNFAGFSVADGAWESLVRVHGPCRCCQSCPFIDNGQVPKFPLGSLTARFTSQPGCVEFSIYIDHTGLPLQTEHRSVICWGRHRATQHGDYNSAWGNKPLFLSSAQQPFFLSSQWNFPQACSAQTQGSKLTTPQWSGAVMEISIDSLKGRV